jgi:4-amino-4-deoxy-L-arabinose transferase-like glycosyltransferase
VTRPSVSSWVTRERLLVAGLLLFTAIVRGGVLWGMRGNLEQDPDAYREIAENVLQHGVYGLGKSLSTPPPPTAYRPPLYPIALSNLPTPDGEHVALWKVAVLHVLLGMGTVWLTFLTAKRLSSPTLRVGQALPRAPTLEDDSSRNQNLFRRLAHTECGPTLAALLVACDPILLNQQTLVMTETLATFLAILSLYALTRYTHRPDWWNAALAGGAIGLAALCRPTFLPWLGLVAVVMLISDFRFRIADLGTWASRTLPNVVALMIAAAAVMSPWAIRNQREFGKPIVTTTHGGYTLWLGNNASYYEWLKHDTSGLPWDARQLNSERYTMMMAEIELRSVQDVRSWHLRVDELYQEAAMKAIHSDSRSFIYSVFYRITQLWSPLPNKLTADESTGRRLLRYGTAAWYVGVYLLAAVGVWRLRWRLLTQPWVWGVLLCFAFTAVHTLYWCNLRMRAPLMPFVALVAAAGVALPSKRLT